MDSLQQLVQAQQRAGGVPTTVPTSSGTLSPNWKWIAMISVIIFGSVVVWGAWNGKFSPSAPLSPEIACPELVTLRKSLEDTTNELQQKRDQLFSYENLGSEQAATVSDQRDAIKDLLDKIGEYSAQVEALLKENATLREALRNAYDDLSKCRAKLVQCRAMDTARRVEHEFCHMEPGSTVLR
jgi:gas vesicle protein